MVAVIDPVPEITEFLPGYGQFSRFSTGSCRAATGDQDNSFYRTATELSKKKHRTSELFSDKVANFVMSVACNVTFKIKSCT